MNSSESAGYTRPPNSSSNHNLWRKGVGGASAMTRVRPEKGVSKAFFGKSLQTARATAA
jgi:hypothetical protein